METWIYISEYTQLALNEFDLLGERFLPVMYYAAAWSYNLHKGKPVRFTEKDVVKWIDAMTTKEAQLILDTMLESKVGGESMLSLIEKSQDEKKKC